LKCHGVRWSPARSPGFASTRPHVGQAPSGGRVFGLQNLEQSSHQGTGQARRMARMAMSSLMGTVA
jgi:hypothetical protein